jgi:hypothetical protein
MRTDKMGYKSRVLSAQAGAREYRLPPVSAAVGKVKSRDWLSLLSDSRLPPGAALLFMVGLSLVFWGGVVGLMYLFWR